jgi:DNA-binding LacI/PurR family transcriptional regulator
MSDILALGALDGAVEAGVSVPGELSVVGVAVKTAAPHATPPLTTVAQPQEEKGRLAARWLMDEIEHGGVPPAQHKRAILPTELVVRESTASPHPVVDRKS